MKILVVGGWQLALVTAVGLAHRGNTVFLLPESNNDAEQLRKGRMPVEEPGLRDLFEEHTRSTRLTISDLSKFEDWDFDVVWFAIDTPVDDKDRANTQCVMNFQLEVLLRLSSSTTVICSSQLPVGSTRALLQAAQKQGCHINNYVVIPENLRLGLGLESFLNPDRLVVGIDHEETKIKVLPLLTQLTDKLFFMNIESAEMVKHALNSFLGLSIVFANEVAGICERFGADAHDVFGAVRADSRVGPRAYLRPGQAFSGGTLARDLVYLSAFQRETNVVNDLFGEIVRLNQAHSEWTLQILRAELGSLKGRRVLVAGLTYKTGTNTLRRSGMQETISTMSNEKAIIYALVEDSQQIDTSSIPGVMSVAPESLFGISVDAIVIGLSASKSLDLLNAFAKKCPENILIVDPNALLRDQKGLDHARIKSVGIKSLARLASDDE